MGAIVIGGVAVVEGRVCGGHRSAMGGGRAKLELMNDSVCGRERLASFAQVDAWQKNKLMNGSFISCKRYH